jgi:hypothetical protein
MINFRVGDLGATLAQLRAKEPTWRIELWQSA